VVLSGTSSLSSFVSIQATPTYSSGAANYHIHEMIHFLGQEHVFNNLALNVKDIILGSSSSKALSSLFFVGNKLILNAHGEVIIDNVKFPEPPQYFINATKIIIKSSHSENKWLVDLIKNNNLDARYTFFNFDPENDDDVRFTVVGKPSFIASNSYPINPQCSAYDMHDLFSFNNKQCKLDSQSTEKPIHFDNEKFIKALGELEKMFEKFKVSFT
jgi:hypothetical protein